MTTHPLSCTTFDDRLADYLEGDLAPAERRLVDAHRASCVRCAALVRDLEQIRADAGELGALAPSRDLWSEIAARIDTPVVPLATPDAPARRRWFERVRTAAVAAALVIATAGVTYVVTISRGAGAANTTVAQSARPEASVSDTSAARPAGTRDAASSPQQVAVADPVPVSGNAPARPATARPVGNVPAAVTYSREIDRLRTIFTQNRSRLDPRTVAIIEVNLEVIDEAIAQSKAALAQDPASRFLTDQLNIVLDKKLDLLRTAALLPNRT